ncbi:MAG: hypothetical protein ABI543_00115 [Ignavibacteria bacterium]
MILISGCNEFIDLTGKFINRLNDTSNSIINLTVSVRNLQSEALPNMLVSIIDDHDSLLITSPKFTNSFSTIHFSLPDEQVRGISPEAQNLIIIAEHPDIGTYINVISASGISDQHFISEFIIDIPQEVLLKSVIENYPFYNKTQKKFMY